MSNTDPSPETPSCAAGELAGAFRRLVEARRASVPPLPEGLEAQYEFLGLRADRVWSTQAVVEHLYTELKRVLWWDGPEGIGYGEWGKAVQQLLLEHLVEGQDLDPFLLADHLKPRWPEGQRLRPLSSPSWAEGLKLLVYRNSLMDADPGRRRSATYNAARVLAQAIRRLRDRGYAVEVRDARAYLSLETWATASQDLETLVRKVGGLRCIEGVLARLAEHRDPESGRYRLPRAKGDQPPIPCGLLLHLGAKHLDAPGEGDPGAFAELAEFAAALVACLEVSFHNPFEALYTPPERVPGLLQRLTLEAALVGFPQADPAVIPAMLEGVMGWLDGHPERRWRWTVADFARVCGFMLSEGSQVRGALRLKREEIARELNLPAEALGEVLEALTHPGPANHGFALTKPEAADLWFRPLLSVGEEHLLINARLGASAFYEALAAVAYRLEDGNDRIGRAFEAFLRRWAVQKGFTAVYGNYSSGGGNGECDLVLESEEAIAFVECKAKALTRPAQAGDDVAALYDLALSLLASQCQALGHELELLRRGRLELRTSSKAFTLELWGRPVWRVSLSLLPYPGLEPTFLGSLLMRHFQGSSFGLHPHADSEDNRRRMAKLETQLQRYKAMLREAEREGLLDQVSQDRVLFLSLPEFLSLLSGARNSHQALHLLERHRRLLWSDPSFGTMIQYRLD